MKLLIQNKEIHVQINPLSTNYSLNEKNSSTTTKKKGFT